MAVTVVQSKSVAHGGFTTFDIVFDSNFTAGNAVAIWLYANNAAPPTVVSIADGKGNTYTLQDSGACSSGTLFQWRAKNVLATSSAGERTVTIVLSAESFTVWIAGVEVGGVDTTEPLAGHSILPQENPGTGANAVNSGAIIPSADNCLLLGCTAEAGFGTVISVGTDVAWSLVISGGADGRTVEQFTQTTAASQAATFTTNSAGADYVTGIMAFKPSAGVAALPFITYLGAQRI